MSVCSGKIKNSLVLPQTLEVCVCGGGCYAMLILTHLSTAQHSGFCSAPNKCLIITVLTVLTRLSPVASLVIAEDSGVSRIRVSKEINTMLEICLTVPTDLFLWVNTGDILALSSPVEYTGLIYFLKNILITATKFRDQPAYTLSLPLKNM